MAQWGVANISACTF